MLVRPGFLFPGFVFSDVKISLKTQQCFSVFSFCVLKIIVSIVLTRPFSTCEVVFNDKWHQ